MTGFSEMSVLLRVARLPELLYTVLRDKRLIKKSCNFASCSFLRSVLIKDKLNQMGKLNFYVDNLNLNAILITILIMLILTQCGTNSFTQSQCWALDWRIHKKCPVQSWPPLYGTYSVEITCCFKY